MQELTLARLVLMGLMLEVWVSGGGGDERSSLGVSGGGGDERSSLGVSGGGGDERSSLGVSGGGGERGAVWVCLVGVEARGAASPISKQN